MTNFIVIGGDATCAGGVYVLTIDVAQPFPLVFGRFAGGRAIAVPPGRYLYIGSARGRHGSSALAGRLLRHAIRSDGRPPQAIANELRAHLAAAGLPTALPTAKRLHWHIDYLLEELGAALVGVWAWRTAEPLEARLAAWLLAQPGIAPLAAGLGASDNRGSTHLLRLANGDGLDVVE